MNSLNDKLTTTIIRTVRADKTTWWRNPAWLPRYGDDNEKKDAEVHRPGFLSRSVTHLDTSEAFSMWEWNTHSIVFFEVPLLYSS